jgi:hypothetical protein
MKKKVKVLMIILIPLFSFFLVYFFVGVLFWPSIVQKLSERKTLGSETYSIDKLKSNTVVFPISELGTGKYDLQIYFIPHEPNVPLHLPEPVEFRLTVQIRHGKETKEKRFTKTFGEVNSRGIFYLFDVPGDLLWSGKADMEITIKDIGFNEAFAQYFEKVSFNMMYFHIFAHNINTVDGEHIQRDNGYRSWE